MGVQADALPAVPEPIAEPIATPAEVPIPEPAVPATDPDLQAEVAPTAVADAERVEEDPEMPELVPQDEGDSEDEQEDSDDEEEEEVEVFRPRRSTRIREGVRRPARFGDAMATMVSTSDRNSPDMNQKIRAAEIEEIMMCFVTLGALLPVMPEELRGVTALTCHMFTVEKFTADGSYDKHKARKVAHGNEQDSVLYPDRSSPTVGMHAILTSLAFAAYNPNLKFAKIDVKGAFIQTEMKGTPVYIKCNKKLTQLITDTLPGIRKYVCTDGTLYCKLLKALYGCVQASKLWYEKLSAFLTSLGYKKCAVEPCVMKRIVDGKTYLLLIYVDDILSIANEVEFERLRAAFEKVFRWITMEIGDNLSYLGMQIEKKAGKIEIDMTFYLEKILAGYQNLPDVDVPGDSRVFEVNGGSPVLADEKRKLFHSTVARLLYLAKRARPDIIIIVGFLCTRVKAPLEDDQNKLEMLLGYLKKTKGPFRNNPSRSTMGCTRCRFHRSFPTNAQG